MRSTLRFTLVTSFVAAGIGCHRADEPSRAGEPVPSGTLIRAIEGGTVRAADGTLFEIPAGALAEDTFVEARALDPEEWPADVSAARPVGTVYAIEPSDAVLSKPVRVSIELGRDAMAGMMSNMARGASLPALDGVTRAADGVQTVFGATGTTYDLAAGSARLSGEVSQLGLTFACAGAGGAQVGLLTDFGARTQWTGNSWLGAAVVESHLAESVRAAVTVQGTGALAPLMNIEEGAWSFDGSNLRRDGRAVNPDGNELRPGASLALAPQPRWTCRAAGAGRASVTASFYREGRLLRTVQVSGDVDCRTLDSAPIAGTPLPRGNEEPAPVSATTIQVPATPLAPPRREGAPFVISAGYSEGVMWTEMAIGADGNIYLGGTLLGWLGLERDTFRVQGVADGIVASFTPQGAYRWAWVAGGFGDTYVEGLSVGPAGEVYATGTIRGTNDFEGREIRSSEGDDGFLVRIDQSGSTVWVATFTGVGDACGVAVAVDSNGYAYVASNYLGEVSYDGAQTIPSRGGADAAIVRYNPNGELTWTSIVAAGATAEFATALAFDEAENLYVAGCFIGEAELGGSGQPVDYQGNTDVFTAKLDRLTGGVHWATPLGSAGFEELGSIVVSGGVVTAAGWTSGLQLDLGGRTLTSNSGWDVFVASFAAADGEVRGARALGGIADDRALAVFAGSRPDTATVFAEFYGPADLGRSTRAESRGTTDVAFIEIDTQSAGLDVTSLSRVGTEWGDWARTAERGPDGTIVFVFSSDLGGAVTLSGDADPDAAASLGALPGHTGGGGAGAIGVGFLPPQR